jgi:hypothetical protein
MVLHNLFYGNKDQNLAAGDTSNQKRSLIQRIKRRLTDAFEPLKDPKFLTQNPNELLSLKIVSQSQAEMLERQEKWFDAAFNYVFAAYFADQMNAKDEKIDYLQNSTRINDKLTKAEKKKIKKLQRNLIKK